MINQNMGILKIFADMSTTALVIRGMGVGFIIGSLVSTLSRRASYAVVRRLLKSGATSPEKALTLKQINLEKTLVKFTLREESPLRRGVRVNRKSPPENKSKKAKIDFNTTGFYIPEDKKSYVTTRYSSSASMTMWVLGAVIIVIGVEIAVHFAPGLIGLIS